MWPLKKPDNWKRLFKKCFFFFQLNIALNLRYSVLIWGFGRPTSPLWSTPWQILMPFPLRFNMLCIISHVMQYISKVRLIKQVLMWKWLNLSHSFQPLPGLLYFCVFVWMYISKKESVSVQVHRCSNVTWIFSFACGWCGLLQYHESCSWVGVEEGGQ